VVARQRPAVLLCVELPSLHVQPPTRQLDQVVAHGLFSDAAAAVVVRPEVPPPAGAAADAAADAAALSEITGADRVPATAGPADRVGRGTDSAATPLGGLALLDLVALTDPTTGDHMTWQVTDHGFRMGLSPRVADVLARC